MMDLNKIIDTARQQKEYFLSKSDDGAMNPIVLAWRGDHLVCVIMAPHCEKYQGLKAAHMCRIGLGATQIMMANDTYHYEAKDQADYERARKSWPNGFMQDAIKQGVNTKGIVESLTTMIINDQGEEASLFMPYTVKKKTIKWLKDHQEIIDKSSETKVSGLIIENLRAIMKKPPFLPFMEMMAETMGMNQKPEAKQYHQDVGAFTALQSQGYVVMGFPQGQPDTGE